MGRAPTPEEIGEKLGVSGEKVREAQVLRLRFGLGDQRERTLAEVGQELGISRERARQLEAEAMQKLRRARPFLKEFRSLA